MNKKLGIKVNLGWEKIIKRNHKFFKANEYGNNT